MLLPNICVAEIIPWRRIKPVGNGPVWLLGRVGWRGISIPVVQYILLQGNVPPLNAQPRCLVVMNRSRNPSAPAFYALAATGLPRMLQLSDDDVVNETAELGEADIMRVRVGTELATIPDLAYIESKIQGLKADTE